uniref:Large ribosomal subunit protein uL22c n=1 Tax=Chara vulgaris TaxID=55564 RepID=RK22_CHAVU|nr:ribosomal protein L22 [Chara vulgaris]Q1ACF8.1 RecName: Full=Large ribosomal subunit protein uL22c; AltName: Full=50S ribosomal protein L22, chloroplastic [Chara vulgaris]ABA61918.1 ribosomal protein L22 [Chara vulgaris]
MNQKQEDFSPSVKASLKSLNISFHKTRKVVNQIRGCSYEKALMILEFMPYRACKPITQLISSAASNANHNLGLKKKNLFISEAKVDEGTTIKRFQPRAQGRAYSIHKPTCHITIGMKSKNKIQ